MTRGRKLRRAGARWRVLAHWPPRPGEHTYDGSLSIETYPARGSDEYGKVYDASGTEFDELVVGQWIHIEQMDTGTWWMNIAGVVIWVRADRDGRPLTVDVYAPGQYDEAVEGVRYGGVVEL